MSYNTLFNYFICLASINEIENLFYIVITSYLSINVRVTASACPQLVINNSNLFIHRTILFDYM